MEVESQWETGQLTTAAKMEESLDRCLVLQLFVMQFYGIFTAV